jgi:ureidoacrylate peracid hydrolase
MPSEHPINSSTTAMLFFDCLKAYLRPEDPIARAAIDAEPIIPALQRIHRAAKAAGMPIFYTQVDHRPDMRDVAPLIVDLDEDGNRHEGSYRIASTFATPGTWKQEVIDEIAPTPDDYILRKQRWNAFYETNFALHLKRNGIDTLMIAGGATEIGVASTAYGARDRDFNLVILRDACRSRRAGTTDFFMDRIFPIFGRVMNVDDAIALFDSDATGPR